MSKTVGLIPKKVKQSKPENKPAEKPKNKPENDQK